MKGNNIKHIFYFSLLQSLTFEIFWYIHNYFNFVFQIGKWQDALINIAGSVVTVIINDSPDKIESFFNCLPIQPDYDQPMKVGERFQGQIQRLTINYKVIKLWHNFKQVQSL